MTGLDPVSAWAAGETATRAAKSVGNELARIEDGNTEVGKDLRAVARDKGYLDQAAELNAKRLAVKEQVWLKFWQPMGRLMGVPKSYFSATFEEELTRKLDAIPAEHLVSPSYSIAGPTLQGIYFTADEPDLREMYLELLAAASDERRKSAAHPALIRVIQSLSTKELPLLTKLLTDGELRVAEEALLVKLGDQELGVAPSFEGSREFFIPRPVGDEVDLTDREVTLYINNWTALGIANYFATDGEYINLTDFDEQLREDRRSGHTEYLAGLVLPSALGTKLAKAVIDTAPQQ